MADVLFSAGRLAGAFLLVFLNGFFVAAEFAYVRVRSTAVESLVAEDAPGAGMLDAATDNLDDYLAVTQLGITISSLGLGWIGEPAVAALIEPVLEPVLPAGTLHIVAFAVGFGFITFLHVVFGELAPKTIAIADAERIALLVSPPMRAFHFLFVPGIVVFNGTANFFTRLIGIPPASETEETLSEEEILMVLTRSGQKGHVDAEEVDMIERVFELDDLAVREVMVPRPDVVTVSADLPLADLRSLVVAEQHTRYPVVAADDADEVVGFVDVKDLVAADEQRADESLTAGDIARDLPVVPETKPVNELLSELQGQNRQLAAVIDEWGVLEGIVTVEDVVEQIVGEIRDEFDAPEREPTIEDRPDGSFAVDGGVPIAAVEKRLDVNFADADVESIGGLVLSRIGRAPTVGDRVSFAGYQFEVTAVDGARIDEIVARPDENDDEPAAQRDREESRD